MSIPHRGTTTKSTYFVTGNVLERRSLFQVEKIARLFIEIMFQYRSQKKYWIHEFVVMPDHFHLILTPTGVTLERSMQLIKERIFLSAQQEPESQARSLATKFHGPASARLTGISEIQGLHLAESGKAIPG